MQAKLKKSIVNVRVSFLAQLLMVYIPGRPVAVTVPGSHHIAIKSVKGHSDKKSIPTTVAILLCHLLRDSALLLAGVGENIFTMTAIGAACSFAPAGYTLRSLLIAAAPVVRGGCRQSGADQLSPPAVPLINCTSSPSAATVT